jgi:hypothetical protein
MSIAHKTHLAQIEVLNDAMDTAIITHRANVERIICMHEDLKSHIRIGGLIKKWYFPDTPTVMRAREIPHDSYSRFLNVITFDVNHWGCTKHMFDIVPTSETDADSIRFSVETLLHKVDTQIYTRVIIKFAAMGGPTATSYHITFCGNIIRTLNFNKTLSDHLHCESLQWTGIIARREGMTYEDMLIHCMNINQLCQDMLIEEKRKFNAEIEVIKSDILTELKEMNLQK